MANKILILCQYFYPEYVSSAMLPTQLSEELTKRGISVDVICGRPQEYYEGEAVSQYEVYKGINIIRVKYGSFNSKNKIGRMINFFSFFLAILMRLNKIIKYKTIFVYSNPPILPLICYWASRISSLKFVFIGFDLYPDNALAIKAIRPGGSIEKLMTYINGKVYSTAEIVVTISEDMRDYILRNHVNLQQHRVRVIPNWYTGEIRKSNTVVSEEFSKIKEQWDFVVSYTGNMGEAQDLDTIVESIIEMKKRNIHEKVLFIFAGHGSRQYEIQQRLLNEKVCNVKFYNFLKGQEYVDLLNITDICLVSLKLGMEGLGVPSRVYGYFAYGKPVISIMSGQTEIATNISTFNAGTNILQGDIDRLIELIFLYKDNPNFLKKAQSGASKIHEELYEKNISINKYYSLVTEILKQEGERRCLKARPY